MAMTTQDLVEFPGEPTLAAGGAVPPVRVRLPLEAGPRRAWLAVAAAATGLLAALALFMAAGVLFYAPASLPSLQAIVLWGLVLPASAVVGVFLAATAATCLLDLTRISPPVLLTPDGLYDRRALAEMIPWPDVAEAYAWRGGYNGIRLRLRRSVNARHNPFRIGTAFIAWRRHPDELYVPVRFLTVRPHPLVHCIAALVRRHGGSVEIEPPWVTIKPPRR
jgi:hypothetical protein